MRWDARVTAVSRAGIDKTRTAHREETPFLVRIQTADGRSEDVRAAAVCEPHAAAVRHAGVRVSTGE